MSSEAVFIFYTFFYIRIWCGFLHGFEFMKRLAYFSVLPAILLTACGTVSLENREVIPTASKNLQVVSLLPGEITPLSDSQIFNALQKSAEGASAYRAKYSYRGEYGLYIKGVEVKNKDNNELTVSYLNNFESLQREISGTFNVTIKDDGNNKNINIACPTTLRIYDSNKVGDRDRQLITQDQAVADLRKICSSLNVRLQRSKLEQGELNTNFPSDSVYANFSRSLSAVNARDTVKFTDIEKFKVFWLKVGEQRTQLAVSVYPYRNGSKVMYRFDYPYAISGDGKHTYSADEIKALHKQINKIAND